MSKEKTAPAPKGKTNEFKYGVKDITKEAGLINDAATRTQLRALNIETTNGVYGWNTQAEVKDIAKKIMDRKRAPKHEVPKTPKGVAKVGAEPKAKKAAEPKTEKPKAEAKPKADKAEKPAKKAA